MNRKIILYALLFIYQYLLITTADLCSTSFDLLKKNSCLSTKPYNANTHKCIYSNSKCTAFYKSCSSYTVGEGKKIDSQICSSITASDRYRKCKVNVESNICEEVYRECEDYIKNEGIECEDLQAGENQRCILFNGQCKAHYKKCEYITGEEKGKCGTNIPDPTEYSTNKYSKCFWDTTDSSNPSCKPTDRTCSEYDTYKDLISISCKNLKPSDTTDTNKKCLYDTVKKKCYEGYGDCGDYSGTDKNTCQKYKHINSENIVDHTQKCDFNAENKCDSLPKGCSDFIAGEDENFCNSFTTEDSSITRCFLQDNNCKEKYISCAAYNSLEEGKKNENDCKAIKPLKSGTLNIDPHAKCVMESNICTSKNKECSEITDETTCLGHTLDKPLKNCVFKDKKCIEQYSSCSNYNNVAEDKRNEKECTSIEDPLGKCVFVNKECIIQVLYTTCNDYNNNVDNNNKNEKDCTSIIESPHNLKCVFTPKNGDTPAKCESKNYECSDVNFDTLKASCTNILNSNTQKCTYNNGSCTTTVKKCKEVSIDTDETDKSNEGICNSAPTEGSNKICTLNKDKNGCIEQDKPTQSESSIDDNNSGNDKYLNKIFIFILCLLI
jgi:hypothetical protein